MGHFAVGGVGAVAHIDAEVVGLLLVVIKEKAPTLYEQIVGLSR
jgi:hypothetical protein